MAALYAGFPGNETVSVAFTVMSDHDYPHLDQFIWVDADTVPLKTVNRQCSSGLQAVADVATAIKAGLYDIGIAAGLESMTVNQVRLDGQVNPKVSVHAGQYSKATF
jgi:acetyl-CoA acetyltransferase